MSEIIKSESTLSTATSLGELNLSDFKSLLVEAAANNDSLAMREEFNTQAADPRWKAHVQHYPGKSDRITWQYPTTTKERQELENRGEEIYSEVSTTSPEHHFVGIRGVVLKVGYGRKLSTDTETICHTTALTDESTGKTVEDRMPMELPIRMIHQSAKEPHELNKWFRNRPYLNMHGSRPPVGQDNVKTSKVRSCAECVAAGEHYIGSLEDFIDPKKSIPKCSLTGYMLFCVFQVGLLDASQCLRGGKATIKWLDVKDAQLTCKRGDGTLEPRVTPFILKIGGLSSVQHWPLGSDKFERDIVTSGNNCYLPEGAPLYSWGQYFSDYLHAKNVSGFPRALSLGGTTVYPVVTDMLTAKLKKDEYQATHLPVFTPVLDRNIISRGEDLTEADWLETALNCLQHEEALVTGGELPAVKELAGTATTPEIKEAVEVPAAPKTSFAALTPPPPPTV